YRLDKVVEDSIDTILATSITVIRTFEKQIKELDKSIKRIMAGMTQTLESVPASARYSLLESSLKLVKSNDLKMRQKSLNTLDCTGANINLDDLQLRILP